MAANRRVEKVKLPVFAKKAVAREMLKTNTYSNQLKMCCVVQRFFDVFEMFEMFKNQNIPRNSRASGFFAKTGILQMLPREFLKTTMVSNVSKQLKMCCFVQRFIECFNMFGNKTKI